MKGPSAVSLESCPLCRRAELVRWFALRDHAVTRCHSCGLAMLDPQPDDHVLASIYDAAYFIGAGDAELRAQAIELKRETAKLQLADIAATLPARGHDGDRRLLEVGCGLGTFLAEARNVGFDVTGLDVSATAIAAANRRLGEPRARCGTLEEANFPAGAFDVVVLADVIEHVRDPAAFLARARRLVKPGGGVFVATPSLDSLSARLMGRHWMEFKPEHLFYFNRRSLTRLLEASGFENVLITPGRKVLNLGYVQGHFEHYPVRGLTPLLRLLGRTAPEWLLRARFRVVASGINAVARAAGGA